MDYRIKYERILVPHDGSEMSDKSLNHATYLSKISGAEIVVLNVIEPDIVPPSTLPTFIKQDITLEKAKRDLRNTLEEGVKQMLSERVKRCKDTGINKTSYEIRVGNPVEEIVQLSQEMDFDIIVMASSRITSSIRVLGSVVRKVMDSTRIPVLLIHE